MPIDYTPLTIVQQANIYVGKDKDFVWDEEEIYFNESAYKIYKAFIDGANYAFCIK